MGDQPTNFKILKLVDTHQSDMQQFVMSKIMSHDNLCLLMI
jgi:hypothetical protein